MANHSDTHIRSDDARTPMRDMRHPAHDPAVEALNPAAEARNPAAEAQKLAIDGHDPVGDAHQIRHYFPQQGGWGDPPPLEHRTGPQGYHGDPRDFQVTMGLIFSKVMDANAVNFEVRNMTPKPRAHVMEKRCREDDTPPPPNQQQLTDRQRAAFEGLKHEMRCEVHHGHCLVGRHMGEAKHRRLDDRDMTLWAKKISLGEATTSAPPDSLNFDHSPTKRPHHSADQPLQFHVTINATDVTAPSVTTWSSNATPSILNSWESTSPVAGPSQSASSSYTLSPNIARVPLGTRANSVDIDHRERRANAMQALTRPGNNLFPPVQLVLDLLHVDYPDAGFPERESLLLGMGIDDVMKLFLLEVKVLADIVGHQDAERLQLYAGFGVAPVLRHVVTHAVPSTSKSGGCEEIDRDSDDDEDAVLNLCEGESEHDEIDE